MPESPEAQERLEAFLDDIFDDKNTSSGGRIDRRDPPVKESKADPSAVKKPIPIGRRSVRNPARQLKAFTAPEQESGGESSNRLSPEQRRRAAAGFAAAREALRAAEPTLGEGDAVPEPTFQRYDETLRGLVDPASFARDIDTPVIVETDPFGNKVITPKFPKK